MLRGAVRTVLSLKENSPDAHFHPLALGGACSVGENEMCISCFWGLSVTDCCRAELSCQKTTLSGKGQK